MNVHPSQSLNYKFRLITNSLSGCPPRTKTNYKERLRSRDFARQSGGPHRPRTEKDDQLYWSVEKNGVLPNQFPPLSLLFQQSGHAGRSVVELWVWFGAPTLYSAFGFCNLLGSHLWNESRYSLGALSIAILCCQHHPLIGSNVSDIRSRRRAFSSISSLQPISRVAL